MAVLFVRVQSRKPSDIVRLKARVFEKTRHFALHHLIGLLVVVAVPLTEFGLKGQKTVPNNAFGFTQVLSEFLFSPTCQ